MEHSRRVVRRLAGVWVNVATLMLLAMFAINCIDIVGSKVFNVPFPGVVELTGYLMAMLIPAAAGIVLLEGQHVRIEIVTAKLPPAVTDMMDRAIALGLFLLISLLAWRMLAYGLDRHRTGEYSDTLHFPFYYVIYLSAVAMIPLCLVLLDRFLWGAASQDGSR